MNSRFEGLQQLTIEDYIKRYRGKLLGSNGKLKKSDLTTKGLSLLPHKMAGGFDLCPSSTEGCRTICLVDTGMAFNKGVNEGRFYKTRFFLEHRDAFLQLLHNEINCFRGAVRLNVFSDLAWEKFINLEQYDWNQFYDYTKIFARYMKFLEQRAMPSNYHLTFSYSGENGDQCRYILENGGTVAVVFEKDIPKTFNGYPVHNGDTNDERWTDPAGHVIGLKFKKSSVNKEANDIAMNTFVVKQHEEQVFKQKSNSYERS